jgi:hypothetical protein
MAKAKELDPSDVLIELLGSGDFPGEVLDPVEAVRIILRRLEDAGFVMLPTAGRDCP